MMTKLPKPVRIVHYVDVIEEGDSIYLRLEAVDEENIIYPIKCPLRLAYDLPIGAVIAPKRPIQVHDKDYFGYPVSVCNLPLSRIVNLPLGRSADACEEIVRANSQLSIGKMQGIKCNNEIYLIPPFGVVRAFLGADGSLLRMLAKGEKVLKKLEVEVKEDGKVEVVSHIRISNDTICTVIEYNADSELRQLFREITDRLEEGDCTTEIRIPDITGSLICRTITVAGYHIIIDADAALIPATYTDITRKCEQKKEKKIKLPPTKKPLPRPPQVDFSAGEATTKNMRVAEYQKTRPSARYDAKIKFRTKYQKSEEITPVGKKNYVGKFEPDAVFSAQDVSPEETVTVFDRAGEKRPLIEFEAKETVVFQLPKGYEHFREFAEIINRLGRIAPVRKIESEGGRFPQDAAAPVLRGRQYLACYICIYSEWFLVIELDPVNYPRSATLVVRPQQRRDLALKECLDRLMKAGGHWGRDLVRNLPMNAKIMLHRNIYSFDHCAHRLAQICRNLYLHPYA